MDRLVNGTLSAVDGERLRWMRHVHQGGPQELAELCDYERKLEIATVNAWLAGLHEGPRLRILDIGCGGGYFVAACRQLGHACEGTEVPPTGLSPAVAVAYADLATALRIAPTIELWIAAGTPIVALVPGTYDLITAHKICFNRHMRANPWSVPEWKFFVEDACRFLAPGGRLVLELNEDVARYGSRRWYDAAVASYFNSVGHVVRNRITIVAGRA